MEKTCSNCEYFVQVSSDTDEYGWGRCMKPETCVVDEKGNKRGVFQWISGCCIDFKPKLAER